MKLLSLEMDDIGIKIEQIKFPQNNFDETYYKIQLMEGAVK